MATIVFKCPQCGGPFEFAEGDCSSLCSFCGVTSLLVGDRGVHRLIIPERVDLKAARTSLRKLLASQEEGQAFAASFSFSGGSLLFLPFWRIRGMAMGWQWCEKETFKEEIDYDENGTRYTRRVKAPNERVFSLVAKPLSFSSPAGEYTPFGMIRVGLAGDVLQCEPMDYPVAAARGSVVDPLKGIAQARQEALAMTRDSIESEGVVRKESRIRISSEWLALLYYPVWNLHFTRGDRFYPVMVDAINGEVIKCRFPGEKQHGPFLPLAMLALLVLGWTTMPLAGVAATVLVLYLLKSRLGTWDASTIIKLLAGIPERGAGVQRG
ncbi:MAG: hypothetical protein A2X83_00705 [Desulfuromonadales bacterium GWD2_54_10]|nr:MAG: hypothetical protein A2X83_00705 [Desulfuromonadales bacterium GWD2_54_10]